MPDANAPDGPAPRERDGSTSDAAGDDADDPPETGGGVRRRTLVRLLVGLGFGIPIVVEGATFLGFVRETLAGDGESAGSGSAGDGSTDTPTAGEGVAVDEELFPGTAPNERMRAAVVQETDAGREFVTSVQVDNTTERVYELRLAGLTTDAGTHLEASTSTDPIPPGESAVVTGRWSLPAEEDPARLHATALFGEGDAATSERLTATLAPSVGR